MLAAQLVAVGQSADGTERPGVTIRVEEFINTQTSSLLNYIFFDDNSAQIPPRYRQYSGEAGTQFRTDQLNGQGTIEVYYQMLNILGHRMRQSPGSKITLTGTNSNTGAEAGNTALSKSRAEAVKAYLTSHWGIDPSRIEVAARNLPALPSSPADPDGIAENRRVEISSRTLSLLDPVTVSDTLRTADPPKVLLRPLVKAESGARQWEATISQGGRRLKEFSGTGTPPEELQWEITGIQEQAPVDPTPLVTRFQITDTRGKKAMAEAELPVEQITIQKKREEKQGDMAFERFNLITFDYDKATLNETSKKVARTIKERITPESQVEITGYTDRLGDEAHNLQLSQDRAVNTAKELGVPTENARGVGETTSLFNNDLPEGRFFSRTVDVVVKTPVKN